MSSWIFIYVYYGIEFHFSKERKIKRIKEILKNLYIPFKETHQSNGTVKIRIYNFDGINVVDEFAEKYLTEKQFNWDLIKLNKEQAKLFLEEIAELVDNEEEFIRRYKEVNNIK